MHDLEGKNIVITGASSGIGRACTTLCNELGANVHLVARNRERLDEVASQFRAGSFSVNKYDVAMPEGIEELIKSIVRKFGKIDGFVHSAGIQHVLPLRMQDRVHFMDVFAVNTFAAFDFSRVISKKAYSSDDGMSIVFISSVMSVTAGAGLASYCASKTALIGGAKAMAIELASRRIRVNCISPGIVEDTNMTFGSKERLGDKEFQNLINLHPGGLGETRDIAQICTFLLSDSARWITGQNIVIDGGYSIQ